MESFHVTMLGARGVGKTSILASMYDQFEKSIKDFDLQLTPTNPASSARLSRKLGELKAQAGNAELISGLAGTAERQTMVFNVGLQFQDPEARISFHDFPGGWFSGENEEKVQVVERAAQKSQMIVVVIDTPALMEEEGRYNELINIPRQTSDFFKRTLRRTQENTLVLFVPVKCESYIQTPAEAINVSLAIQASYEDLLYGLSGLSNKLAIAIAPIQTLGNVAFSHYDKTQDSSNPLACFQSVAGSQYSPKDVEQLFYYMLAFLLNQGFIKSVQQADNPASSEDNSPSMFNADIYTQIKQGKGFVVLQGKDLLSL